MLARETWPVRAIPESIYLEIRHLGQNGLVKAWLIAGLPTESCVLVIPVDNSSLAAILSTVEQASL